MSTIYVNIATIQGEASAVGYNGQIECFAMRHAIVLPVAAAASRTEGTSRHGPLVMLHTIDKASPLLKQAVLNGTNLGTVKVTRLRTIGNSAKVAETIELQNAYAVRVDVETMVDQATLELGDEMVESFHLEYSQIAWQYTKFEGSQELSKVTGGWSLSTQTIV